ncbi:hypothetical protein CHL76_02330 [Marinococcus halophilus]|uniref:Putative flavodoxin-1 n=1 Tax=Marinococcus halophilus TaxID=1371 RepID=A0A510Y3I5_MARHA|nr:flavodoxin domain-containing protein [Marinococcus halophilus]OZT81213.1 hypothetical protein CHL76_02330 [Marinococcus halophilus]GEK57147.1 putative flavodoxin-1 [Marinococcus halophilus]
MNVAIVYASMSGNTQEIAEVIKNVVESKGFTCTLFRTGGTPSSFHDYDMVLFGSYTWGNGELPSAMRTELRSILKERQLNINEAAVFGSGETQFPKYCRAVDEMKYHLENHNVPVRQETLKVEQSCRGSQMDKVTKWTNEILEGETWH